MMISKQYHKYKATKRNLEKMEAFGGMIGTWIAILLGIVFVFYQMENGQDNLEIETYLIIIALLVSVRMPGYLFSITLNQRKKELEYTCIKWTKKVEKEGTKQDIELLEEIISYIKDKNADLKEGNAASSNAAKDAIKISFYGALIYLVGVVLYFFLPLIVIFGYIGVPAIIITGLLIWAFND